MTETTNRETEKKRPRPYRFAVRLSPEEHAHIAEQAKIVCRTPPDMLRALGLGQRLKAVPRWPEDVFRAIKSFGGNLNQLAHQANMGHVDTKAVEALQAEFGGTSRTPPELAHASPQDHARLAE